MQDSDFYDGNLRNSLALNKKAIFLLHKKAFYGHNRERFFFSAYRGNAYREN